MNGAGNGSGSGPENHELFDDKSPGRIPESLIDAALDGEICDQMQDEIAHALQYDHTRRAELLETSDAVRALDLDDIPMPDMQCAVLNRLDQHDRFIPRSMRRWVRTGRMAVAAGVLLGLMLVAGLQSVYPRLTTIGVQSTPVDDVATAVQQDAQQVVSEIESGFESGVEHVRASLSPLEGFLASQRGSSSRTITLTINQRLVRFSEADIEALNASGVGITELNELQTRFPSRIGQGTMTLVSTSASHPSSRSRGRILIGDAQEGLALIQTDRLDREKTTDDRIADLP